MAQTRLAILGSGWGAFRLLKEANPNKFAVTVISPRNHMLFTPLLSSASVGTVSPGSICEPLRPHCAARGARYCEAHAEGVDLDNRVVQCRSLRGEAYDVPFDRLVVAVGKRANDFGIPGVKRHALFMKETADAARLRDSLLTKLEEASCLQARAGGEALMAHEEAKVRQLLSVVVVGGGPTSVRFAEELTGFISREVPRAYPHLRRFISVHLVEWGSRAPENHTQDQALRDYSIGRLSGKTGVELHLGERVAEATPTSLRLCSGRSLPYGTLVWNVGIRAVPLVQALELPKTVDGSRLLTDACLRVAGHEGIYAIGDCASAGGGRLPQTAHVASQQAAYLAQEFNGGGRSGKPFVLRGVGALGGSGSGREPAPLRQFRGYLAWLGWRSAYWSSQLSLRNRLSSACGWMGTVLLGRSLARLGQDTAALPISRPGVILASGAQAAQPHMVLDEHMEELLDDIGMRPMPQLTKMPPIRQQLGQSILQ